MERHLIKPIILDENFRIEPDAACWQLLYRKEGEVNLLTGKPSISRDQWFHASLRVALQDYVDRKLRDCSDLIEILDRLDEIERNIDRACEGIMRIPVSIINEHGKTEQAFVAAIAEG